MTETIDTLYGPVAYSCFQKAKMIRLLICDVDGVLSDGRIYMGNQGEELKTFHTRDGFGLKALLHAGIDVAIITGRQSAIVDNRMQALGISHVFQGKGEKLPVYQALLAQLNLRAEQAAYIGDDVVDLPVMQQVGLSIAVADAHPLVTRQANLTTRTSGGLGAVREVCDLLLQAQDKLEQAQGISL